mgnify:CR=1 FL=1
MNRSERALNYYSKGFNCAQSVIVSFADILKLDEETALRLASGFGGGMGRMQQTCGAVTGAFMVIGFLKGKFKSDDQESSAITNSIIQEFSKRFATIHGSINCKALIKFDLNSEEELAQAKEADVFNKKCTFFVKEAVEILEEILIEYKK